EDPLPDPPAPRDFVETLRPRTFRGHEGGVSGIAAAKSGQRFVSVGFDQTVRIWSVAGDPPTIRYKFKSPGVGVTFYGDDHGIAACDGLTIALLDATRMKGPKVLESPRGGVSGLVANASGSRMLAGLSDGYLRLWDTAGAKFDEWPAATRGPVA